MNNRILALLAVVAIATTVMAPVIAKDRRAPSPAEKCGLFKKFDRNEKICRWKY